MATKSRYMTSSERTAIWERWQAGETVAHISRALNRVPKSVRDMLKKHGGIRPSQRQRSARSLTADERESIARGISAGDALSVIAKTLNRSPSTISREIQRNGGAHRYRAVNAEQAAWERALRPKRCKLALNKPLCRIVAGRLKNNWSPQQIAGYLKRRYPDKALMHVSHETIYRSLYVQTRGVLKKELMKHLRQRHQLRHSKKATHEKRGKITDLVSIKARPADIEARAIPGHWEGDLIMGTNHSCMATLVERQTRYVMLVKVPDKTTEAVVSGLIKQVKQLPKELALSLTWDRGAELKSHQRFTVATNMNVYFCDPRSPWQRGSNENTNGLLRQYFPKGTDLSVHSQRTLNRIARELNERPRKTLEYATPAEYFDRCIATTG